jgi:hypothetical protein
MMALLVPVQCAKIAQGSAEQYSVGEGKDAVKSPLEGYEGTRLIRVFWNGHSKLQPMAKAEPRTSPYDIRQAVRHFGALVLVKAIFDGSQHLRSDRATMYVSTRPLLLEPLPSAELSDRKNHTLPPQNI